MLGLGWFGLHKEFGRLPFSWEPPLILFIWCNTPIKKFFPRSFIQNHFWTHQFWCFLVLLLFLVSPLPHWQNISLCGLFPYGETNNKKSHLGILGELGGWGIRVKLFLVKICWTLSTVWAGALVNHLSWNGQMHWVFKKIHWSQTQPLTTMPSGTFIHMDS